MSVNLSLLPFEHNEFSFSHAIIPLGVNYGWFDALGKYAKEQGIPVPKDFTCFMSRNDDYEESHYGTTTEDEYGKPLLMIGAGVLVAWLADNTKDEENSARTRAAIAYLGCLAPETFVALYWS